MTNEPFEYRESAAERLMREELERQNLYRNLVGGSAVAETIRQIKKQQDLLRAIDFDAPYRGVLDTLERERKQQEEFRRLTSTAWAASVSETARSVVERHADLVSEQRRLSNSVLDTVKAYEANLSVVETAVAATRANDVYRRLIADALPSMSVFGAIAERMLMVDTLTLRASEGETQTATAVAAEMVIEAQRIFLAVTEASNEEESDRLIRSLVDAVLQFVKNLGPNTIPELKKMGLINFGTLLLAILAIPSSIPQNDLNPAEKAAFAELHEKIDLMREEERRYHEAEETGERSFLEGLPRAQLSRNAIFRDKPTRDGAVVLRADRGMKLAILRAQSRWRLVAFRDPLSNQLARAWVYADAVSPLAAEISIKD